MTDDVTLKSLSAGSQNKRSATTNCYATSC